MTSTTTIDRPPAPCRCGSVDLIGPFEMDGIADGTYYRHGLFWTVCRSCGRSALVRIGAQCLGLCGARGGGGQVARP